jgi:hypothetical protein
MQVTSGWLAERLLSLLRALHDILKRSGGGIGRAFDCNTEPMLADAGQFAAIG